MIRQVVQGILHYTRSPFELVVLDNDSSLPEVVAYLADISTIPGVRVVRMPVNRYYWPAINEGIRQCDPSCSFVVALNDDCVILGPSWVERLLSASQADPRVGFVGDLMTNEPFPPLPGIVDGYCAMFRREVFETVGMFNEGKPFWWGFVDFQLRAFGKGVVGRDVKRPGDCHDHLKGIVHHLRGRTLAGVQSAMDGRQKRLLFGSTLTPAIMLAGKGYYGPAALMLMRRVFRMIKRSAWRVFRMIRRSAS